jgi:hypothetical protein
MALIKLNIMVAPSAERFHIRMTTTAQENGIFGFNGIAI